MITTLPIQGQKKEGGRVSHAIEARGPRRQSGHSNPGYTHQGCCQGWQKPTPCLPTPEVWIGAAAPACAWMQRSSAPALAVSPGLHMPIAYWPGSAGCSAAHITTGKPQPRVPERHRSLRHQDQHAMSISPDHAGTTVQSRKVTRETAPALRSSSGSDQG